MSEEEKKAIANLIDLVKFWKKNNFENSNDEIILNLIDKQQKEIEIWKETENDYEHELARKDEEIEELRKENFDIVYMQAIADFKEKIREIIEKHYPDVAITKLKELLDK